MKLENFCVLVDQKNQKTGTGKLEIRKTIENKNLWKFEKVDKLQLLKLQMS